MANKIIAIVKLAPGHSALYDELSNIHLTIDNPRAYIYDYTNTKKIKKYIKEKSLILENGTLDIEKELELNNVFYLVKEVTFENKKDINKEKAGAKPVVKDEKGKKVTEAVVQISGEESSEKTQTSKKKKEE